MNDGCHEPEIPCPLRTPLGCKRGILALDCSFDLGENCPRLIALAAWRKRLWGNEPDTRQRGHENYFAFEGKLVRMRLTYRKKAPHGKLIHIVLKHSLFIGHAKGRMPVAFSCVRFQIFEPFADEALALNLQKGDQVRVEGKFLAKGLQESPILFVNYIRTHMPEYRLTAARKKARKEAEDDLDLVI